MEMMSAELEMDQRKSPGTQKTYMTIHKLFPRNMQSKQTYRVSVIVS